MELNIKYSCSCIAVCWRLRICFGANKTWCWAKICHLGPKQRMRILRQRTMPKNYFNKIWKWKNLQVCIKQIFVFILVESSQWLSGKEVIFKKCMYGFISLNFIHAFRLSVHGKVTRGNTVVDLPYRDEEQALRFERLSSVYLKMKSDFGMTLMWDGNHRVYLTLNPSFKHKVRCFCVSRKIRV